MTDKEVSRLDLQRQLGRGDAVGKVRSAAPSLVVLDVDSALFPVARLPWELLTALQRLSCSGNSVSDASFLRACTSLRMLNFSRNMLEDMDFVANLKHAMSLNIGNNRIGRIPVSIVECDHLSVLNLAHNALNSKSVDILGRCVRLKELRLSNNRMDSIPASFENLTRLESLQLNSNCITAVPIHFGQGMTRLSSLSVQNNSIRSWDMFDRSRFPQLESFQCLGNPALSINQQRYLAPKKGRQRLHAFIEMILPIKLACMLILARSKPDEHSALSILPKEIVALIAKMVAASTPNVPMFVPFEEAANSGYFEIQDGISM